jgi:hypothetical protein
MGHIPSLSHTSHQAFPAFDSWLDIRFCPPCTHLDHVTGKALLKPLADRGGLRADILSDGVIRVGDLITPEPRLLTEVSADVEGFLFR